MGHMDDTDYISCLVQNTARTGFIQAQYWQQIPDKYVNGNEKINVRLRHKSGLMIVSL